MVINLEKYINSFFSFFLGNNLHSSIIFNSFSYFKVKMWSSLENSLLQTNIFLKKEIIYFASLYLYLGVILWTF